MIGNSNKKENKKVSEVQEFSEIKKHNVYIRHISIVDL
jgi:hypothetical protein